MTSDEALAASVRELATRPGHEKVRALLHGLLTDRLGAASEDVRFEVPTAGRTRGEVRGRIDALVGRTVIEVKSNLDREAKDAEGQLARYLPVREAETGQRFVGIATDGALFRAYEMRDGVLTKLSEHKPKARESLDAHRTLAWLDGALSIRDALPADEMNVLAALGRQSTPYHRAAGRLAAAWHRLADDPEASLKRQLWERHLALVYGTDTTDDELWVQHTYLVCVAKAIAAAVLTVVPDDPRTLLDGAPFREAGVHGAVESDFFDWVLADDEASATVREIVHHVRRFDLSDISVDLLKVLYESLIDPGQRHDLGEYYTPDWLAARVTDEAMSSPLTDRVLDPSCGSGTFLFHAVRAKRRAMEADAFRRAKSPGAVRAPCTDSMFIRSPSSSHV